MNKEYQPKRQADENQSEGLSRMRGRTFFALLMAMRTRKTKVVLDDFGELELKGEARDLLVVAPGGVYKTWAEAIKADFSNDLLARARVHVWSSSDSLSKLNRELKPFLEHAGPRVLLINAEALSSPGRARNLVLHYLGQRSDRTYVAIDESTCIKNRSKRTKFIVDHVRPLARWRRILSGLSTPRSLMDVFWQWHFLDWKVLGFQQEITFKRHVAFTALRDFGGRMLTEIIDVEKGIRGFKPEAIEEVKEKIEPHSFRVEFRPKVPSEFSIREIEMTKQQRVAYEEMKTFATTALSQDSHVTATVVIAQIVRMHQILLGHVMDENGVEHVLPENRTEAVLDILRDHEGKAIVWCSYDHDVRKVSAAIAKELEEPVARFWGGNLDTREEEELRFRTDPGCRFMVATPDAGGKGRTWDVADLAVFYSNRDNLELRDQAEQRTMGKDKERGVDNIDLVVKGTVDEKILHALRNKINLATTINGDTWREWVV